MQSGINCRIWIPVALAGLFLVDPVVAFRDYLPDAVGYLLICMALVPWADLDFRLERSLRCFHWLLGVGLGQLVAQWFVHRYLPGLGEKLNPYEIPVSLLLCSFLFGVAKCVLLMPALRNLFLGLQGLNERNGGTALLGTDKRGRTLCEKMTGRSTRFAVLTSLLSVLPELAILTSFEYEAAGKSEYPEWFLGGGGGNVQFDWYSYASLFRTAAAIIAVGIALMWLIGYLRCVIAFGKDVACMEAMEKRYAAEILPKQGMLVDRRLRGAFAVFGVGLVFAAHFREAKVLVPDVMHSQGVVTSTRELLPGIFFGALAFFGVLWLGELVERKVPLMLSSVLLSGVSLTQILLNRRYMSRFYPMDSLYREEPYNQFLMLRLVEIAEAACTLLTAWLLLEVLWQIVRRHTGALGSGGEDSSFLGRVNLGLHREMRGRLIVTGVLFLLAAVAQGAVAWWQLKITWLWVVALGLSLFAIGRLLFLMKDIREEVGFRYGQNTSRE